MSKTERLLQLAKHKKVRVHFRKYLGNNTGTYDSKKNLIEVEKGNRNPRNILYTLSHELGHANYRHGEFYSGPISFKKILLEEIEAWNYASRLAKRLGFFNKYFIKHRNDSIKAYLLEEIIRREK